MTRYISLPVASSTSLASNYTSSSQDIRNFPFFAFQFVWTGAPVGTVSVDASVDNVTWAPITNMSSTTGGTAGCYLPDFAGSGVPFVRAIYTRTSGTGSLTITLFAKAGGT